MECGGRTKGSNFKGNCKEGEKGKWWPEEGE